MLSTYASVKDAEHYLFEHDTIESYTLSVDRTHEYIEQERDRIKQKRLMDYYKNHNNYHRRHYGK